MSTTPHAQTVAYDPFGEPVACERVAVAGSGDRRARRAAVAVFWTLALALVGGRVYVADQPFAQTLAAAHASLTTAVATVIR